MGSNTLISARRISLFSERRAFVIAAAVVAPVLSLVPVSAATAKPGSHGAATVAVYGDAPYGTSNTDTAEFQATPAFIDSVNADPQIGSVVHVGDIHSGKQFCTPTASAPSGRSAGNA